MRYRSSKTPRGAALIVAAVAAVCMLPAAMAAVFTVQSTAGAFVLVGTDLAVLLDGVQCDAFGLGLVARL
jgi:hypothetical protein